MRDAHRQRPLAGLVVRRDRLWPDEITSHLGMAVTTPLRCAYDLARGPCLTEAVVAVDALARVHGFDPEGLLQLGYRHLGARGSHRLPEVIRLANRLSGSPMETRIRLALLFGGLPMPVLQHPVGPYELDLSYPALRLGIEYDGREHLTPERARRDLVRQDYLTTEGWHRIIRFRPEVVLHHPRAVAATVRRRLTEEASRRGVAQRDLTIAISAARGRSATPCGGTRDDHRLARPLISASAGQHHVQAALALITASPAR